MIVADGTEHRADTMATGADPTREPATPVSDDELFAALRTGDQRASRSLFKRYFLPVRGYFINKAADPGASDDLVQKTFMVALMKPENFRGESSFRSYLFGVANKVLLAHYRQQTRARLDLVDDVERLSVAQLGPGVSTLVSQRAEAQQLIQALRRIDIRYQAVFEMFYWQNLSAREIGEVLRKPEGTIRSNLRLAKRALLGALDLKGDSFTGLLGHVRDILARAREVRQQLGAR